MTKEELIEIIQSVGLDEKVRGEKLSIEQFGQLTSEIEKRQV